MPAPVLRVLGIDTATRAGSVALVELRADEPRAVALAEVAHAEDLRHAETLLPAIDRCLEDARLGLADLDGLAVSIGPGSFTGLRVGLATAKGLVLATSAWLVGVPTLEAHASAHARRESAAPGDLVCACLDARKGEVYTALFAVEGAQGQPALRRLLADAVEAPADALARLSLALTEAPSGTTLRVVGDGAERYRAELIAPLARGRSLESKPPSSQGHGFAVAELGIARYREEGPADAAALAPAYLRASEAEIKRRARTPEPR